MCVWSVLFAADPIEIFAIMTTGLLGFFLVKSQRDQLLISLSTGLDFNRTTLTQGGWALTDRCMDDVWAWVFICSGGWELHVSMFYVCVCVLVCNKVTLSVCNQYGCKCMGVHLYGC